VENIVEESIPQETLFKNYLASISKETTIESKVEDKSISKENSKVEESSNIEDSLYQRRKL
jgi:hypothetical protein